MTKTIGYIVECRPVNGGAMRFADGQLWFSTYASLFRTRYFAEKAIEATKRARTEMGRDFETDFGQLQIVAIKEAE